MDGWQAGLCGDRGNGDWVVNIQIYDSGFRGRCRTERCEQIDCMGWLEKNHPDRWPLIFHVPNETRGTASHMQMRKKEGVKAGVSDIIDFSAVRGAFELKRLDRTQSRVTKEQRDFLQQVADSGGFAAICYGFEQFRLAYSDYLRLIDSKGS